MSDLKRPTPEQAALVRERALAAIDTALVVRESATSVVERGEQTFIALYTAAAEGAEPRGVLLSLTGAAALVEDMTTLLNSSPAILAFIREVLSERKAERAAAADTLDRPGPLCPVGLAPGATCPVCLRVEPSDAG